MPFLFLEIYIVCKMRRLNRGHGIEGSRGLRTEDMKGGEGGGREED